MIQQPIALADCTQEQIDALSHGQIADWLRRYPHPLLKAAADSIDYLAAQEDLLEKAQQTAERACAELEEHKRPLDEPMARLNRRVIALTAALQQIADMDPAGQRADDLGRAARVARSAIGGVNTPHHPSNHPVTNEGE